MNSLSVLYWPPQAGDRAPAWEHELLVLATSAPVDGTRDTARADIRAAVCEVAGLLLEHGPERIEIAGTPGSAPRLLVDGAEAGIGVSISHADSLSLAVLHRRGAVGIDVMRLGLASDWARVAHDYLGMATATLLAAASEAERPLAFCQAWTGREAALKLRGEQLAEWASDGVAAQAPPAARIDRIALSDGLVGMVATAP
jgi:4'-phosphopantetheinyl transferase